WKVNKIFSSDEEWEKAFEELKKESPSLKNFEGKLNNDENILEYLEKYVDLGIKAEIVYVYAHLKSDEDTSNSKYQAMMNKVDSYMAEFASYTAYFVPEILSLDDELIRNIINANEKLKMYNFMFEDILKEKPHILS
ncbi:oligoendopeptidase F, partial [Clostridium perfringens]|nr:oligoendopeptidase F [Clostridium perfringens]